jgi:hypothetical protein
MWKIKQFLKHSASSHAVADGIDSVNFECSQKTINLFATMFLMTSIVVYEGNTSAAF